MNFIDHTGHIFYMDTYPTFPVGYEYEKTPYIFWFDADYSKKLSVNNYYVLPIRIALAKKNDVLLNDMTISIESEYFKLYKGPISDNLRINETDLVNTIRLSDLQKIEGLVGEANDSDIVEEFSMLSFYVFAYSEVEGTFLSNILISVTNNFDFNEDFNNDFTGSASTTINEYTPITVGATFVDESEALVINGRNIGVNLPKDIIKALYQTHYFTDNCDENLFNIKMKEYLINQVGIKNECGNFNSVFDSLKWFGWGGKLHISKLLKTDNEFMSQYVRDYFNIEDDILDSFKYFKNTSNISLHVHENYEGSQVPFDFSTDFYGENKPEMKSLFTEAETIKYYDEYDKGPDAEDVHAFGFSKQYYDFAFTELGLKLSCLAYMLDKYFLPIHININSAAIDHKVFANDIKFIQTTTTKLTEEPLYIGGISNSEVVFDTADVLYIYNHSNVLKNKLYIIDDQYNLFSQYDESHAEASTDKYYIVDDPCFNIPIKFFTKTSTGECIREGYYNTYIVLHEAESEESIYEESLSFYQIDDVDGQIGNYFDSLVIVPKLFRGEFNVLDWEGKTFCIDVLCNGRWYSTSFVVKVPDFKLKFGYLQYMYTDMFINDADGLQGTGQTSVTIAENVHRQLKSLSPLEFNAYMYAPELVQINNIRFLDELKNYNFNTETQSTHVQHMEYINKYNEGIRITDADKYYNMVHIYELHYAAGIDGTAGPIVEYSAPGNINDPSFRAEDCTYWVNMYNEFFNSDCTEKEGLYCKLPDSELLESQFQYDFYLMHDENTWYGVFISKLPLSDIEILNDDKCVDMIKFNNKYVLKHEKSNRRFLINRMKFMDAFSHNNFKGDDTIVASVENDDLPYVMSLGTKWKFIKKSIGGIDIDPITSKTNAAIMSLNKYKDEHPRGYYDVEVTYSIDAFENNSRTINSIILVD